MSHLTRLSYEDNRPFLIAIEYKFSSLVPYMLSDGENRDYRAQGVI